MSSLSSGLALKGKIVQSSECTLAEPIHSEYSGHLCCVFYIVQLSN